MTKQQEFTGKILSKEPQKVYKKNEFYGNINYKLTVLKEEDKTKLSLFVYSNLIDKEILQLLKQGQYINKSYHFFCERKNKNLILTNLQELKGYVQET